jgi:hypothetical protein
MASIVLLAQALPSASSGVDWLYQFTNNLTNLTTQNGGALTQLGMTELSCIALFTLISMVVNWQTSSMTFRLHHHQVQAGDLTKFLLQLIICCLLENYWVNPFPGASFGINSAFILYGVTALFGPIFIPLLMTKTFRSKFFHFLDVLISFAMIRAVAAAFIFVWGGFMNAFIQQTFNGNYSMEMWLANLIPCTMVFIAFIINMLFIPSMTQAIFGGAAGAAGNISSAVGNIASTIVMGAV